jgi:hypothetical protein
VTDIAEDLRFRAEAVRASWSAIPLRAGTPAVDWREQAMRDIELIEAAAETIESLRAALYEARREICAHEADTAEDQREYAAQRGWWSAFRRPEERVSNSYRMEAP